MMRNLLEFNLNKQWYHQGKWIHLLKPFKWIYYIISNAWYIRPSEKLKKTVIVCGNINTGGMGKTPLVIWFAQKFKHSGLNVVVILKPYRVRRFLGYHFLSINDDTSKYGDEACMIKNKLGIEVVVTFNRSRTLPLIEKEFDVILLDDGLQDFNTPRSFNLCITDYMKKFGNGQLLPEGPLRNTINALINIDEICVRGFSSSLPAYSIEIDGFYLLSDSSKKLLKQLPNKQYIAISSMAHPEKFHDSLKKHIRQFDHITFNDHHAWRPIDFFQIHNESIIVTEKDAVKLNFDISVDVYVANTKVIPNQHLLTLYTKLLKTIHIDDKV